MQGEGIKDSKIQKFKDSKIQRFIIQGFSLEENQESGIIRIGFKFF